MLRISSLITNIYQIFYVLKLGLFILMGNLFVTQYGRRARVFFEGNKTSILVGTLSTTAGGECCVDFFFSILCFFPEWHLNVLG